MPDAAPAAVSKMSLALLSVSDTTLLAVIVPPATTVIDPLNVSTSASTIALVSSMSMLPPGVPAVTLASRLFTVVSSTIPSTALFAPLAAVAVSTSAVTRLASALLESRISLPAKSVTSPAFPALIRVTTMSAVAPFAVSEMSLASLSVRETTSIAVMFPAAITSIKPFAVSTSCSVMAPRPRSVIAPASVEDASTVLPAANSNF